jgi:hypothetical protein
MTLLDFTTAWPPCLPLLRALVTKVCKANDTLAPGVVYTEDPYSQVAHLDFDDETLLEPSKKSWIIHMPLQKEGMLLSVWDLPIVNDKRDDNAQHDYIFLPFVITVVTENDVYMGRGSGTSKHPGNICYRSLLDKHCHQYIIAAAEPDKKAVIDLLYNQIRVLKGGRFLEKIECAAGTQDTYHIRPQQAITDFPLSSGVLEFIMVAVNGIGEC